MHNAINLEMRDALWSLLDAIEADDEVGVVVFRGAGDTAFSAGADISEFGTAPSYIEARRARLERDLWGRLLHFAKPTIAAIHGYALGAGCELSLLCDFRIAAEDALIGLPEAKLGYIPTAGGTQTLPRTIGPGRALDMLLDRGADRRRSEPSTTASSMRSSRAPDSTPRPRRWRGACSPSPPRRCGRPSARWLRAATCRWMRRCTSNPTSARASSGASR